MCMMQPRENTSKDEGLSVSCSYLVTPFIFFLLIFIVGLFFPFSLYQVAGLTLVSHRRRNLRVLPPPPPCSSLDVLLVFLFRLFVFLPPSEINGGVLRCTGLRRKGISRW